MNFSGSETLRLPWKEFKVFKKFWHADKADLTQEEFKMLQDYRLVLGAINGKSDWFGDLPAHGLVEISQFGKQFREHAKERRFDNIRYIITTSIAVVALILSIISLCQ